MHIRTRSVLASSLVLCMVACGGSGGGGSSRPLGPSGLRYANPSPTYAVGVPIASNRPLVKGKVDGYTVDPALPEGLVLDPRSGIIAGVPLAVAAAKAYLVRAINAFGSARFSIEIRVLVPVSRFAFFAGDDGSIASVLPDERTGLLQAVGFAVTARSAATGLAVSRDGRRLHVLHPKDRVLVTRTVDRASGNLNRASVLALAEDPGAVVMHPTADFLYVLPTSQATILRFRIDENGLPKGPEKTGGIGARWLTFSPAGRWAFGVNSLTRQILVFAVDRQTGLLEKVSSLDAGARPRRLALHPSGLFAYLADWGKGEVRSFSFDPASGALRQIGSILTGRNPSALEVEPHGRFAFDVSSGNSTLQVFKIEASGELNFAGVVALRDVPSGMRLSPDGRFAYVVRRATGQLSRYAIDAQGRLADPVEMQTRSGFAQLVFDRAVFGLRQMPRHAYVASRDKGLLFVYEVAPENGSMKILAALAGVLRPGAVALHATGRLVFVASEADASIATFTIDLSGRHQAAPTLGGTVRIPSAAPGIVGLAAEASGRFLYLTRSAEGKVSLLRTDAQSGLIRFVKDFTAGPGVRAPTLDPSGRSLLVANGTAGEIALFSVDPSSGELKLADTKKTGLQPQDMAMDPAGRRVFVANNGSDTLTALDVLGIEGKLGAPSMAAKISMPGAMAMHPSGRFLFVHSQDQGMLVVFAIDFPQSALTERSRVPTIAGAGTKIALDPQGRFLLITNPGLFKRVEAFAFDEESATLKAIAPTPTGAAPNALAYSRRFVSATTR